MKFDLDFMILTKNHFPFSSKVLYYVKKSEHKPIIRKRVDRYDKRKRQKI